MDSNAQLYAQMSIRPEKLAEVTRTTDSLVGFHKEFYSPIEQLLGIPWPVVGCLDYLESSFRHDRYLGNGEPLDRVTQKVPKGRGPFKTWSAGAVDALLTRKQPATWTIGNTLDFLEHYNGLGYRNRNLISPYLFNYSNLYVRGRFTEELGADGHYHSVYNPQALSKQAGAACILKLLSQVPSAIIYDAELDQACPLIGPSIWHWPTGEEFLAHTKTLVRKRLSKAKSASKTVPGVSITLGKKSTIVRITREPKMLTEAEVLQLTEEYGVDIASLLTKRKIPIMNSAGAQLNAPEKKPRSKGKKASS